MSAQIVKDGERCVWMFSFSDVVVALFVLCVWCETRMCSPSGLLSCDVVVSILRTAARVGAGDVDVKSNGVRWWCVCSSRMWCWLFGCVHRWYVCGAVRGCQFDWIRVMSRRYVVFVESGADLRRAEGWRECGVFAVLGCGAGCLVV